MRVFPSASEPTWHARMAGCALPVLALRMGATGRATSRLVAKRTAARAAEFRRIRRVRLAFPRRNGAVKDFVRRTTFIVVERPETKFWRCVLAEITFRKRRRRILLDCDLTAGAKPRLAYPYAPCDDSKMRLRRWILRAFRQSQFRPRLSHNSRIECVSTRYLASPTEIKRKALNPVN